MKRERYIGFREFLERRGLGDKPAHEQAVALGVAPDVFEAVAEFGERLSAPPAPARAARTPGGQLELAGLAGIVGRRNRAA